MRETIIQTSDDTDRKRLLKRLLGTVFHLTTADAFPGIVRDGRVGHNRNGQYPLNCGSQRSFGRLHGYVCLFDLRNASPAKISLARELCDFLYPDWLTGDRAENPVYLVLRPEACHRLVPNASAYYACRAGGRALKYLPGAECWYPGNLPLEDIGEVLRLTG